jgi:hypothetical protein
LAHDFRYTILPVPVFLKRLAAARLVLIFGINLSPYYLKIDGVSYQIPAHATVTESNDACRYFCRCLLIIFEILPGWRIP